MGKIYARAARYALYPNELGLCGPRGSEKGKLYQYLTTKTKVSDKQARKLLEQFVAATAYLELIAKANQIEDWLDPRVVDAYWIGNELLNRVRPEDLRAFILGFAGQGLMAEAAAKEIAGRIHYQHRPHHSFHVMVIGGLSGQVERGSVGQDLCRIGWGEVAKIQKDGTLSVLARFLRHEGNRFLPELNEKEERRVIQCDPQILPRVMVGDLIAFHWGRAVEVITLDAARRLEYWTERTLAYFNK
jgi:hypothetical protein